jgi:colanic acid/amylovoran biosynthesis glycosyltransferase
MNVRIGYFAPEFPEQTSLFFWREGQALAELGIEFDWVSTRRPPKGIVSHSWSEEAEKNTTYLVPFGFKDFLGACIEILRAGPFAWLHCLSIVITAKDLSFSQRLRLLALILPGGKLAWLAREKGWSHIHVPSCADAANVAMFASILSGITYNVSLLGPTLEGYGPNQEQKWKHAAFGLVMSQLLFKVVKERLAGFLPDQVEVAPVGVNLDEIKRHNPYIPWEAGEPCRIYSCGRLNRVKGHSYLIETVALLQQRGFDVRLKIGGEDEKGGSGYRRDLEKFIQDKSMSDYVELLGAVSEEKHRQCLEDAHVFALASLNEGISVAIMEAMAMEMPVVVTDVGGNSELIDNGVDAIMVQPEKPEEMADAIEKVLKDKALTLSLSQESRKKVAAKFNHRISAGILARCLEKIA